MTRDELIAISTQELGKLPADELSVVVSHFGTEDRAELARRLADEAERLAFRDPEAHAIDGLDRPHLALKQTAAHWKMHLEILHVEDRRHGALSTKSLVGFARTFARSVSWHQTTCSASRETPSRYSFGSPAANRCSG